MEFKIGNTGFCEDEKIGVLGKSSRSAEENQQQTQSKYGVISDTNPGYIEWSDGDKVATLCPHPQTKVTMTTLRI